MMNMGDLIREKKAIHEKREIYVRRLKGCNWERDQEAADDCLFILRTLFERDQVLVEIAKRSAVQ